MSVLYSRKALIHIFPADVSFIQKDQRLLSMKFSVIPFLFKSRYKILIPVVFIKQLIFLFIHLRKAEAIFIQFAGYHSLLPILLGKVFRIPVLLLLGGTDCVSFPEIRYGNFRKGLLSFFTKWSILLADHLTPVHNSLVYSKYTYSMCKYKYQGFQFFIPSAKNKPWTEIYNGYKLDVVSNDQNNKIKNTFLTVTQTIRGSSFYRKGIDLIFEIAAEFRFCTFTIVGADDFLHANKIPDNIKLIAPLPHSELIQLYASHEFYFQLSICEGFPNALCEAMINKCIPIVSNVAAMPFIVENSGFILEEKDKSKLKDIINRALSSNRMNLALKARDRILNNFTEEQRGKSLIALLTNLIENFYK